MTAHQATMIEQLGQFGEPERSSTRPLVIAVVNPTTRGDVNQIVASLERRRPSHLRLDVRLTRTDVPLAAILRPGLDQAVVVIACGGDGTLAEVVTALGEHPLPIGVVPAGSTNVVAREHRIPLNADAAARLIFGRHALRPVDIGICGDRRFLHMAGAGLDSRLFASTNPALKRRAGWLAYVAAGARNLLVPSSYFTVRADNTALALRSPLVLIANGAGIIRPFLPIFPGIRYDDGLLDVIAFTAVQPAEVGVSVARFLSRSLDRSAYVVHLRARQIALDADPPLPLQLDGDVVGETPATFGVQPAAVRLIVPAS